MNCLNGYRKHAGKYERPDSKVNEDGLIEVKEFLRGGGHTRQYKSVNISLKSESGKTLKQIKCYTHRLIAETFHPNPFDLPEVNHIDKDKHNNTPSNLEWVTHKQNMFHATYEN